MWEQTKRIPQVKMLILIVLAVSFIPFSYMWYEQLISFKCAGPTGIIYQASLGNHNCTQQTGMHWAIFYGINGMAYGVPLLTFVLKSKTK